MQLLKNAAHRAAFFLRSTPSEMGPRVSAYKRFAAGKTLAQGQFICPEHVKSSGVPAKGEAFCGERKKYGLKAARRAPQFSKR